MAIVKTMPMPEKIAPATKYGGKIVACQPGVSAIAKSNETTECTESTSGVANAARKSNGGGKGGGERVGRGEGPHSLAGVRQPREGAGNSRLRIGFVS